MSKLLLARPDNAPNFCFEVVDVDTGESTCDHCDADIESAYGPMEGEDS